MKKEPRMSREVFKEVMQILADARMREKKTTVSVFEKDLIEALSECVMELSRLGVFK